MYPYRLILRYRLNLKSIICRHWCKRFQRFCWLVYILEITHKIIPEKKAVSVWKCFSFTLEGSCKLFEQMPIFKWLQKLSRYSKHSSLWKNLSSLYAAVDVIWREPNGEIRADVWKISASHWLIGLDQAGAQQWNFRGRISDGKPVCLYMQHTVHMLLSHCQGCIN